MDYETTIQRLREMESCYHSGFSSLDRTLIDSLYYYLFGKEIANKGCGNCYRDAYIEIYTKLKREKNMPKKSSYQLKAGAVITFFGSSQAYTNANLTDDVAVKYLSLSEDNSKMFAYLPTDWEQQVANFQQNCTNDNTGDVINSRIVELETQATVLAAEKENLLSELAGANESLEKAYEERDVLMQEVNKLQEELERLKSTKTTRAKKSKTSTEETQELSSSEQTIEL